MRMRVRIQPLRGIDPPSPAVEASALVNSGFEASRPEVIVPASVGELLGMWPTLPEGTRLVGYETAGGNTDLYRILDAVRVAAVTPERTRESCLADLVINPLEHEVILSQRLGAVLQVVLELGRGTWRFEDEPDQHRRPEPRQIW